MALVTPFPALDEAVRREAARIAWPRVSHQERILLLGRCRDGFHRVSPRWVASSAAAKGVAVGTTAAGEEWAFVAGTLKLLRSLQRSLEEIITHGVPQIPGAMSVRADGQVVVPVAPRDKADKMGSPGSKAEVWLMPGVQREDVVANQALRLRKPSERAELVVILAAGNASLLVPGDLLHAMFVENRVVVLKVHPVNAYLGPLLREAFAPLVEPGFLTIVEGDVAASGYLCDHPEVDVLHLTGSDRTYEAIVFGNGATGAARKASSDRANTRHFTAELGNITPVIVVPGPWTANDFRYQALHVASMHGLNASFNCLSPRLLVQHASWPGRAQLLDELRKVFAAVPTRPAYFPGAMEKHARFIQAHPNAERFGGSTAGHLPWTLIAGVDPANQAEICFREESFCSVLAESTVEAAGIPEYLERAVDLVNERVWGNLAVSLVVHPQSMADPAVAAAVDRAVARLRYGSVCVNTWGAFAYMAAGATWGAFPGNLPTDIQSGHGVVNNVLMLDKPQKSVHWAPFREGKAPIVSIAKKNGWNLMHRFAELEAQPSFMNIARLIAASMRG